MQIFTKSAKFCNTICKRHISIEDKMAKRYYDGKDLAERYHQYRFPYPKAMFEYIVDYYNEGRGPTCNNQLAVDVGCGSGQATFPLAEYFQHVIGCDPSKELLSLAPSYNDKVEFKMNAAEQLDFLEENSVDLLTASASFHYFDQEAFYSEAKRVLKPGGVLAIFAYGFVKLDNDEGQNIFDEFYNTHLEEYLLEVKDLDTVYYDKVLPFPEWKRVSNNDSFSVHETWTLSQFIGFLTSNHPWEMYIKQNPHSDYLQRLRERFALVYECKDSQEAVVKNTHEACLLIGRKPTRV